MTIECLISFEHNNQGVYYAGQELSGIVNLSVDTTKRIRAIHITVSGYAKVRWLKKGYPHDSERAMCRAYRSYLSSRSYVLGTCGTITAFDWLAGDYSYTFHVILPENLPTSFDGKYGQIHYEIITTIERPGRYPKVYKLPFTVIQPLDLNIDAIHRVPLDIMQRKRFWSFCCPTGPLTIKFSAPYCGYAPGQKIHFVLYINNESSIDIMICKVKLKQEVSYESHDPQHEYRYDRNLIASKQFGNVLRWSRKVYRGYLELPSIIPSSIKTHGCPINVQYAIKITIHPTEFHWKVKLKVPLTIGSVPIMHHNTLDNMQDLLLNNNNNHNNNNDNNNNSNRCGRLTGGRSNDRFQEYILGNRTLATTTNIIEPYNDLEIAANMIGQEQQQEHDQQIAQGNYNLPPIILVTNADDPPAYIPMLPPPSYEEAMALSEHFFDADAEFMEENVSLSSLVQYSSYNSNSDSNNNSNDSNNSHMYKPRYPVYYNYETPIIPPETLYDTIPPQVYRDFINNLERDAHHYKTLKRINIFRRF